MKLGVTSLIKDNFVVNAAVRSLPDSVRGRVVDIARQLISFLEVGDHNMFSTVAIETTSKCNRRCSYCPVSVDEKRNERGEMSIDPLLYKEILRQLADIGFKGKLALQGYGEPLLDKNIEARIIQANDFLPDAYITFYSNGDLLKPARYEYEEVGDLKYQQAVRSKFQKLVVAGLSHIYITNHDETANVTPHIAVLLDDQFLSNYVSYYGRLNKLQNRCGSIDLSEYEAQGRGAGLTETYRECDAFMRTLTINVDGTVSVCANDFDKRDLMGTVGIDSNVVDIWNDPDFRQIRNEIRKRRHSLRSCLSCLKGK